MLFFVLTIYGEYLAKTVWGPEKINSPLLEKLLTSKAMIRIKGIDQSGPLTYFGLVPKFSRFDHSVGVLVLLQKAKTSIEEQAAGLLHDASHTVFSHIGDHLFYKDNQEKSYQDTIHLWFLRQMEINPIIKKYKLKLELLDPDHEFYTALERPLPELCADRIQYNIHTGIIFNKISKKDAQTIINDLEFKHGKWFFKNPLVAQKFANLSLDFTKNFWGSAWNYVFYEYFTKILKRSLEINLISKYDLHFKTDQYVLEKLENCNDPIVQKFLNLCRNLHKSFIVVPYNKGNLNVKPKFRGIDPLVCHHGGYKKLSELNGDFKKQFEYVKSWCEQGYGIKLL